MERAARARPRRRAPDTAPDRTRPGRRPPQRPSDQPGSRAHPSRARQAMSAPAKLRRLPSRGLTTRSRSRSRLLTRAAGQSARRTRSRPPSRRRRAASAAPAATGGARRAPPPRSGRAGSGLSGRDRAPAPRRPPRPDQLVGPRKEPLQELARRLVARRARVDPTEEDLDQHASDLRGENALDRLVEGGDVERLGMAQRGRAGAGGERLVDVQEVERHRPQQALEAPLMSSGSGAGRRRGPLGSGMLCPMASTFGFPPVSRVRGFSPASRISLRLSRIAARESEGATIRTRWPRSASSSEVRRTNSLISCREPQGWGLTCAIERDSAPTRAAYGRSRVSRRTWA